MSCKLCKIGNIFVMPSSILNACNHVYGSADEPFICDNVWCGSPSYIHPCSYCKDSWWFSSKKLSETRDIGLPESSCVACKYEDSHSELEICRDCEYICNGCYNGFCKRYHQYKQSCLKEKCLNKYCSRCSLFNNNAYSELLPIIGSEVNRNSNKKKCIVCVCGLDKLIPRQLEYEYYYHYPNFKDRFNCYFIIELLKQTELVQIVTGYNKSNNYNTNVRLPSSITNVLRNIAVYATGFHFIDTEDVYIPDSDICIGERQCELSVLHDHICQYSALITGDFALKCSNNFVLLDIKVLQSIEYNKKSYNIITMPRYYRPEHSKCIWYIHVCDCCKVSIWANKSCYYDYNAKLSPDEISRTICDYCINQQDKDYLPLVKLCPKCRFKCNGCQMTMCNSHMESKCECCDAKYCHQCINIIGFSICDYCNSSICLFCQIVKVCQSSMNVLNVCTDCESLVN